MLMITSMFFFLIAVLFSLIYARIEFGLDKYWVELGKDPSNFWKNKYGKYTPYHVWMLGLDAIVNLPALYVARSIPLFLTCVLSFPLLEDIFYFFWRGRWIGEDEWTVKDLGFVKIKGVVIPRWYIIAGVIITTLLAVA